MTLTDSMKLVEETGELGHDLVEDFVKIYEEVEVVLKGSTPTCGRCGAKLHSLTREKHLNWHKDISFRFFVIQSYIKDHTAAHVKAHADITKLLEEA